MVYNQLDSTEKFYVTLRISLGKTLFHFYMVSASKSTFAYNALEYRVVEFLRNVNAQWPVLAGVTSLAEVSLSWMCGTPHCPSHACHRRQFHVQPLLFQFAYIVDTLVYAGTRDNVGENYLHLGSLLFRYWRVSMWLFPVLS